MATSQIKLKVSADTEEARRKIAGLGDAAVDGMNRGAQAAEKFAASANKAAAASEKAANATKQIGEGARLSNQQITHMVTAMASIGVGLATSYAASRLDKDSTAKAALDYGGGILTGAGSGAMLGAAAGPVGIAAGAAIGGTVGAVKAFVERDNAERAEAEAARKAAEAEAETKRKTLAANIELVESFNKTRERTLEQKRLFESLADSSIPLSERLGKIGERSRVLGSEIAALEKEMSKASVLEDPKKFARAMSEYQAKLNERDKLKDAAASLSKAGDGGFTRTAAAVDSLAKIGGFLGNGAGGDLSRQQLDATKESVAVLKRIESKSGNKTTWG